MSKVRLGTPLESAVQRACLAACEARGLVMFRNNSANIRAVNRAGKERMFRAGAGVGSADLIGIFPSGRFFALEVKRPGEVPRPEQYDWLERVRLAGGVACWADDAAILGRMLDVLLGPAGPDYEVAIDRATGDQEFTRRRPR